MAATDSNVRGEALGFLVGTLLVVALAAYGAWSSARNNARRAEEMPSIEHATPAQPGTPRAP